MTHPPAGPDTPPPPPGPKFYRLTQPPTGPDPIDPPKPDPGPHKPFSWFGTSPSQPLPGPGDEGTDQPRELVGAA